MAGGQGFWLTSLDGDSPRAYDRPMALFRPSRQSADQRARLGLSGLGVVLLIVVMMALLRGHDDASAPVADEPLARLGVAPGASRTDDPREPKP